MRDKLFRRLFGVGVLCIVLTSLVMTALYFGIWKDDFSGTLRQEAEILSIANSEKPLTTEQLNRIVESLDHHLRITVIDANGVVAYDSDFAANKMENHKSRPEVMAAFNSGYGIAERNSETLHEANYYYAIRSDDGRVIRVARVGANIYKYVFASLPAAVALFGLILVASYFLARYMTRQFMEPIEKAVLVWSGETSDESLEELRHEYKEINPLVNRLSEQRRDIQGFIDQLEEERNTLRRIMRNITEGVLLIDIQGKVLSCNKRMKLFFGLSPTMEVNGQDVLTLSHSQEWLTNVKAVLHGEEKITYETDIRGGRYRIVLQGLRDNAVKTGVLIIAFDITADYTAAERRREFSSNVSHELKTPLTTISGYAEVLANHFFAKDQDAVDLGGRIYKAAQRMLTLIDNIMHLSKVEENSKKDTWSSIQIQELLEICWQSLENQWKHKPIKFKRKGEEVTLIGQRDLLQELFMNLFDNAIKFSDGKNVITASVYETTTHVNIAVSDKGRGIDEEKVGRIFERFYRGEGSRNTKVVEGSGIGLSLVKHIVDIHNGEIQVNSEPGEGTTFLISLPKMLTMESKKV